MGKRATTGACLQTLVKMAVPLLQQAERLHPRKGPGAKPDIPDWFMGLLIMTSVLKRKKSKSARDMRRSHLALGKVNAVEDKTTGELKRPHHVSPDGYYNGRQVTKDKVRR